MIINIKNIRQSFGRALLEGDLFQHFYEIFLSSNPAIAPMFKNTDFNKQKGLLRQSINLAIMYADGHTLAQNGLNRIQKSHAPDKLNIPSKLYPFWKKSFLEALSDYDSEFTEELRDDWDHLLQQCIDFVSAPATSQKA